MSTFRIKDEASLSDCRKFVFSFISLGVLVLILYSNTFQASWHFDDAPNIRDRGSIHLTALSWDQIRGTFFDETGHLKRPVAYLSLAINYYFNQDNVFGYHIVNILIHFVTAVFLFLFIHQTLRLPRLRERYGKHAYFIALLSSVLWATNPIQTQAVTYIVQRMASMAGMFYIMSMYFYIHGRVSDQKSVKAFAYSTCIITGLLACGSKENAAMLPVSILVFDLLLIQGLSKKKALRIGLLFLLCALVAQALLLLTQGVFLLDLEEYLSGYSLRNFTLMERVLTESRVIVFYISLLLYPMPSRLCIMHSPTLSTGLFDPPTTFLSILLILGVIAYALAAARKYPLISYCILFFFLNHIVESSVLPLELAFEHRNYTPSMLFFVPISILIVKGLRAFSHKPAMYTIITAFVILIIISNGHGTFIRNVIWKTDESLWMDAVDKYPNASRGHHNLAHYYDRNNHIDKALRHYTQALTLPEPSYGNKSYFTRCNLGLLYERTGRRKEAEEQFRMSIATTPTGTFYPAPHNNLGVILIFEKRYNEAFDVFVNALGHAPNDRNLHHNLGVLFLKRGQPHNAIHEFEKAQNLVSNVHNTLEYLGVSYKMVGEYGKAACYLRRAVSANPHSILTRLHLAEIYLATGQRARAERLVTEALSDIPSRLVFSELQACANETVLRELPDKSHIIPLLEKYYSREIDSLKEVW
jgi:tetratricopeptide (TPR) repeat protein